MVTSLACDDWILVIGFSNGLAKVHSLDTGLFLDLLNCRWDQYDLATPLEPVWVSVEVGEHLVVTGTSDGVVMVRNKGNMGAFYKDTPHGDTTVLVLKVRYIYIFIRHKLFIHIHSRNVQVVGDLVLTCSCHSVQVMRHRRRALVRTSDDVVTAEGEYMEHGARLEIPGPGGVTAVDTDGRIVLIGEP